MNVSAYTTLQPTTRFYKFLRLGLSLSAVLLFAAWGYFTHAATQQRELHVVNGFDVPIRLTLNGSTSVTVEPRGQAVLEFSEGRHSATLEVDGRTVAEDSFEARTGWLLRLLRSPLFVYNAGDVLVWQQVAAEMGQGDACPLFEFYLGEAFVEFKHVDYRFVPFPRPLEMRVGESRSRVSRLVVDPAEIVQRGDAATIEQRLNLAELHLLVQPTARLLDAYASAGAAAGLQRRCLNFLHARLAHRPVDIAWHQTYQALAGRYESLDPLRQQYRQWLAAEPDNAALVFLLGELTAARGASAQLYQRALDLDPTIWQGWTARGQRMLQAGEFDAARRDADEAFRLAPGEPDARRLWVVARLAQRRAVDAIGPLQTALDQHPDELEIALLLLEALVADNQLDAARQQAKLFAERATRNNQPAVASVIEARLAYLLYNFDEYLDHVGQLPNVADRTYLQLYGRLEKGELPEAERLAERLADMEATAMGLGEVSLAVSYQLANIRGRSIAWKQVVLNYLRSLNEAAENVAGMIEDGERIDFDDLTDWQTDPRFKALVLLLLAAHHESHRSELLDLAERFNFRRSFPYHLVRRGMAQLR